jgi:hypothetical protein
VVDGGGNRLIGEENVGMGVKILPGSDKTALEADGLEGHDDCEVQRET